MTHTENDLERMFLQAARSAMYLWRNGQEEGYKDLANDLWVWYLERPSTQEKISSLNKNEVVALLKRMALQSLSDEQHKLDVFRQLVLYSSDNVKEALNGKSTNWALIDVLPKALAKLRKRNEGYADAIESRYAKRVVPKQNAPKQRLKHAVRSLTEIVNALCISGTTRDADDKLRAKDGPGSRAGMFPQDSTADAGQLEPRRRAKGGHSDPTAAMALALIANPDIRSEVLREEPITEYTKGPKQKWLALLC